MTKKSSSTTLFRRLNRLFKSGPRLRKKVSTFDTTMASPDKSKSSGVLLFQKSSSPTYATITSNAYNLSERLMRYQDFQEMEYSVSYQTLIPTPDGAKQIGELADQCINDPNYRFIVYSYDHEKKQIVPAFGKQARQTCVDHAWKITFDNGKTITASPEHRLMLRDGTYRKVEDLQPGDAMMPFHRKDLFEGAKEGTKGYRWVYTMDEKFRGWTKEHQLIAEWVTGRVLTDEEVVHHINFDKTDNRPENLRIMLASDHNSLHATINNDSKWSKENHDWIEEFKRNHAVWMRDNAPTRRRDITFARIIETSERVGFDINKISSTLDISPALLHERLVANGFATFKSFIEAYAAGQKDTLCSSGRPGLLTRDLSFDLIKKVVVENDTKRSLSVKLGCTVNVLDKFLNRRLGKSWNEIRLELGFINSDISVKNHNQRTSGRSKGSNKSEITYKQICDVMEPDLTLPRLSEKLEVNKNTIISRLAQNGYKKYSDFRDTYENCKVVSIEYVGEIPLYDLTVDGYKNFATDSVISHNTPELASALDIYADESVPQDEKGRILHVYSENEKIKEILDDLYFNVLNLDFNLRPWVRNLVKYGDFLLYIDVSPEYGVMNAFPIPVNEIEREENYDREDPFAVRFRWVTLGNRKLENWEVGHFRLLGNDMFLPYGSSVVEPARRIWRQLILIEDAMLVYRVVRAPERRVFYIDVGNLPPDEIEGYIEKQKHQLRSSQVIDRDTGKVDLRYNPLPIHKDTPIPLLDGRTVTIEALAKEKESDPEKDQWVYSVQDENQKLVPGKVTWCGKNYTAKKLVKVWLDNETYVTTAPEHPFVLRDGSSKRADELVVGTSLMPLYRNVDDKGYEHVYSPGDDMFKPTHQIVAKNINPIKWEETVTRTVHHKSPWITGNKRNNAPENIEIMTIWDHRKWHIDHLEYTLLRPDVIAANAQRLANWNKTDDKKSRVSKRNKERNSVAAMKHYNGSELHKSHNENRRIGQKKSWDENATARKNAMRWNIPDEMFEFICETVKQNPKWGRSKIHDAIVSNEQIMSILTKSQLSKRDNKKFSFGAWEGDLKRRGFEKLTGLRKSIVGYKNHKVSKIEFLDVEGEDVYCMTVVGPNGEDDRHNFAAVSLDCNQAAQVDGIILKNSVDEDYFIPVRGQDSGTKIDTLAGGQNTAAVEDVEYIQKKMIAALKIPRAYLGYDDMLSSKATLAQEDIRFARTINVIQKTIISELNKIAIIHLYAHGYTNEDLMDFSLRLTSPSTVAEQQKLELWRARFEIAGSAPEGMLKPDWIMKNILNMTDKEIRDNAAPDQVEDGASGGGGGVAGGFDLGGGGDGGDFDLGDDDSGGGDFDLGDEDTDTGEDDEDLTAGVEPEEEDEPDVELITSGDDQGKKPDETPVKPAARTTHNRKVRRAAYGNADIHMPNFADMVKPETLGSVYDADFFRTLGKNDTLTPISPVKETHQVQKTMLSLSPDIISMLRRMSVEAKIGPGVTPGAQSQGVLHEAVDVQTEIDNIDDDVIEGLDIDWGNNK